MFSFKQILFACDDAGLGATKKFVARKGYDINSCFNHFGYDRFIVETKPTHIDQSTAAEIINYR